MYLQKKGIFRKLFITIIKNKNNKKLLLVFHIGDKEESES